MRRLALYIAIVTSLVGCFKDETYNTNVVIRCYQQDSSDASFVELSGAVAYSFTADTTDYMVASYDDALAGLLTDRLSGEKISANYASQPYPQDGFESAIAVEASGEVVVLVVVDTEHEDYAYRNYSMGLNLATTYMAVQFRPWYEGELTQNGWQYVIPEPIIVESEEEEESEEDVEESVEDGDFESEEEEVEEEIEEGESEENADNTEVEDELELEETNSTDNTEDTNTEEDTTLED